MKAFHPDMSLQIDDLATELLHIILSKLDPGTLRNCRLVKRQWRDISNEYFLRAVCTNTIRKFSGLKNFAQREIIAWHTSSITFVKKESEKWPDRSNASEVHDPALLGQEIATSHFKHLFKRLDSLAISDGRPFPTMCRKRNWSSDATTEQFEILHSALSNSPVRLSELCVEWVDTPIFQSKAVESSQIWRSLTILRLGIFWDGDLEGLKGIQLVLRGLSNLTQLHLSTPEDLKLPLYHLINEREVTWPCLTALTLQGFVAREPILQRLFTLPSLRSISIARIVLDDDDGCWIRLMMALQKMKCKEAHLFGWLANSTTDAGWYGDSNEDGSLFQEVAEWLKRDERDAGSGRGCPLTVDNINL